MGAVDFVLQMQESRVIAEFDDKPANVLWVTMRRSLESRNQYFSIPLLNDMRDLLQLLRNNSVTWTADGAVKPVHYAVLKSEHPDYFSLGGDLGHFHACIQQRDSEALRAYSMQCADMIYEWATVLNNQATTIALVQGRALGGGFEAALSADFLIAEEHSEFGFPEILFGLFPCTGGMSLLARRVGVHQAERMMTNGRIYSAAELKEMGIVDEVCPSGDGIAATEALIANHAKRRTARLMLQRGRHRVAPLDYEELKTVVDEWVETAMMLPNDQLRAMEMLSQMQRGSIAR